MPSLLASLLIGLLGYTLPLPMTLLVLVTVMLTTDILLSIHVILMSVNKNILSTGIPSNNWELFIPLNHPLL
jgi:hypothetical protein